MTLFRPISEHRQPKLRVKGLVHWSAVDLVVFVIVL